MRRVTRVGGSPQSNPRRRLRHAEIAHVALKALIPQRDGIDRSQRGGREEAPVAQGMTRQAEVPDVDRISRSRRQ
jgi:hypothetical protein